MSVRIGEAELAAQWSGMKLRPSLSLSGEAELDAMASFDELLARLPSDPAAVRRMRHRVCAIGELYFRTPAAREDCLYLAAASLVPEAGARAAAAAAGRGDALEPSGGA